VARPVSLDFPISEAASVVPPIAVVSLRAEEFSIENLFLMLLEA